VSRYSITHPEEYVEPCARWNEAAEQAAEEYAYTAHLPNREVGPLWTHSKRDFLAGVRWAEARAKEQKA
jgi:hypothetical protein